MKDKNANVPLDILKELLTPSELRMVKQRFLIMNLLTGGSTVRSIAEQVGVGTDTVVRVARKLEGSVSLRQFLKKDDTNASKWVFGQSEEK